jgi:disulfide bond formation protein DsbB
VSAPPWQRLSPRAVFALVALTCLAALAAALTSQHVFGMQPCPWCVLQRLIFVVIGVLALVFALLPAPGAARAGAVLLVLLGLTGMFTALWHHFVGASAASCDLTVADRIMSGLGLDTAWPEVFAAFASCADARVNLFGVPYEFWSLSLYTLIAAVAAWLAWRTWRARP